MPFYFHRPADLDEVVAWHLDDPTGLPLINSCLQSWLDGFYDSEIDSERQALLDVEPRQIEPAIDAYLAASAEFLAHEWDLAVPAWTKAPCRFLPEPVFSCREGSGMRDYYLVESPPEYRHRGWHTEAAPLRRAAKVGALRRRGEFVRQAE